MSMPLAIELEKNKGTADSMKSLCQCGISTIFRAIDHFFFLGSTGMDGEDTRNEY